MFSSAIDSGAVVGLRLWLCAPLTRYLVPEGVDSGIDRVHKELQYLAEAVQVTGPTIIVR